MDGNRAIVDFGDGRVPADMGMTVLPEVNDSVWILTIDGKDPLVMGFTIPRPGEGTVTSIAGTLVTVSTSLGKVDAQCGFTVGVGDLVKLYWNDGPYVVGPLPSPTTPGEVPSAPDGGPKERTQVFTATESGSYRGRWWTPQVRAGDTNQGIWAYGAKIPGTIPGSATILSVEVFQSIVSTNGAPAIFGLHGFSSVSGAPAPSFGPQQPVGISGGFVPLPTSWGDSLKAGGGYLGVGVNHGGDTIFNSVAADGMSGALRIRYRA
ncbi:hypothetical protein P5G50_18290 [Leifsonia sp. F6_8S_P_1B]|uniref:Uncharacterized protein n=1 Tax=Leifsonia williamsii TaxID=3035919 RepID=A0ABT8KG23_9MICO|nr:hypothetical protein [Leifsonia williamsii]MDN4616401.1 hypothetical protein [Leifsonia williamsii]